MISSLANILSIAGTRSPLSACPAGCLELALSGISRPPKSSAFTHLAPLAVADTGRLVCLTGTKA